MNFLPFAVHSSVETWAQLAVVSSSRGTANLPNIPNPASFTRTSIATPSLCNWSKRTLGCGRLRHVERDGLYGHGLRLQFGGDLCQFVSAARNQHQIMTVASEQLSQFVSNAAGRASDRPV